VSAILNAVVPLFAVVLLGYAAGRTRFFGEAGVRSLITFVFSFALPPLLFRLMARTDFGAVGEWGFVGAYFASEVLMFALGAAVARTVFAMRLAGATIMGFGCAFSNGVLLTLPLLLWLYGDAGGLPALLIIMVNTLSFGVVTMLLELARHRGSGTARRRIVLYTARSIVTHPIIAAAVAGVAWSLAGLGLPEVLDQTLAFIGRAGAPAALFALGATLGLRRIEGSLPPAAVMVGAKLLLHPLIAWLAFAHLLDLDPLWINAGVLFAASPIGLNVYIFAQHYEAAVETASSAVLISTGLAMLTITALLVVLPPVAP